MSTVSALNPDLLSNAEAAALLGIKPNTLEIWRSQKGKGPDFIKLDPDEPRSPVRYWKADVLAWLEARKFSNTSAYSPNAKQAI